MIKVVPDTSVILDQALCDIIQSEYYGSEILIPEAVLSEIENHANKRKDLGYKGISELKRLRSLCDVDVANIKYVGRRPKLDEITIAGGGEIDAMIRDIAREENAVLITSDRLQKDMAITQGVETYFYDKELPDVLTPTELESYFRENISSVHLKENTIPIAKKGVPGKVELIELDYLPLDYKDLDRIAKEIVENARQRSDCFIEIEKKGAKVIQYDDLRITIAKPPFSEGYEITAIKPVNKLDLSDYNISDKLLERLSNDAKGILVSGSPGAGKSTFAQALAEYYYYDMEQLVKTMESPRDLNLDENITQYAPLEGDLENTADILLLVRPDFTIFDEVRKTKDFEIYSDLRLSGVGMIGVVHATRPIDAVQRFVGRLELGIIPSVIDTTIYIDKGGVASVYSIELTVKVPTGMQEADLARPVIEIKDFDSEELLYEIYTYGEQTVVIDINKTQEQKEDTKNSSVNKIVRKIIENEVRKIAPNAITEITLISNNRVLLEVDETNIGTVIGKNGKSISKIEERAGIQIEVSELSIQEIDNKVPVEVVSNGNYLSFNFTKDDIGSSYDIIIEDEYLFTATVGKKAMIRLKKNIEMSQIIMDAMRKNTPIYASLRDE